MNSSSTVVDAFVEAVRTGEWDAMTARYAPNVIFDATVPRWHFSIQGVRPVIDEMRGWFPNESTLSDLIVEPTAHGAVVAFERRWQRPVEHGRPPERVGVRQTHILRITDGHISYQHSHCAGIWDEATFLEIELEAPRVSV